jgi:UDP-3-O-[3-hydroxymyristoyl] glucosamine N-acyltransferase
VSNVYNDVPAGARWGGIRAKPVGEWMREIASLERLARSRRKREGNAAEE